MGFDIWRRVSRLRCHHYINDSWPWSGPGHDVALVFYQSLFDHFWYSCRNLAGRHPMAIVGFRRIFGWAPSNEIGGIRTEEIFFEIPHTVYWPGHWQHY